MITLDQSKIDAPDFPRSLEWWRRFVPQWADVTADGSTITIKPQTEPLPKHRGHERAAVAQRNRNRAEALVRWLGNLPRLEPAIVEDRGERCRCWRKAALPHEGHCCFRDDRICHAMPEDMRRKNAGDMSAA